MANWTSESEFLRFNDPQKIHAVIFNPVANAKNASSKWRVLRETSVLRKLGLGEAPVFDGVRRSPPFLNDQTEAEVLENACLDWILFHVRAGARNFLAAGGDGTVFLLLNSLMRAKAILGLDVEGIRMGALGIGSSNDFHKPVGNGDRIRLGSIPARINFSSAFLHDIGLSKLAGYQDNRYFCMNASVGVTAEGAWFFNQNSQAILNLKQTWVNGAVLYAGIKTCFSYKNRCFTVKLEDGEPETLFVTNLGILKNPHFAGKKYDFPLEPDNGQFGVCFSLGMNRLEMLRMLNALNRGQFMIYPKTRVQYAKRLELGSRIPFSVETDGEVAQTIKAEFQVLSRALLLCP